MLDQPLRAQNVADQSAPALMSAAVAPLASDPLPEAPAANSTGVPRKKVDDSTTTSAPWGETILGLDVSGASSTDSKAVFLAQAMVDWTFLGSEDGPNHDGTTSFFAQLRVAGMAQPGNLSGNIGTLSAAATYLSAADNATPDKIVQSIEGSMGIGVQIKHHSLPDQNLLTGSLVADFGALTPLSASQANPPVYSLTNQILQQYAGQIQGNNVAGCAYTTTAPTCYVAFIPQDRTHFYRHYEAGFRVRLYEKAASGGNTYIFPGNLDMLIGQNEYVTKGKLSGFVLHFGGVIPVPKAPYIYGFGAMDTTLSGESLQNDAQQLILDPAPSSSNLTYLSPSVYTIAVGQPKRDRYRLGFGVDIIHLIQAVKPKS
jgi:hypothetical protein